MNKEYEIVIKPHLGKIQFVIAGTSTPVIETEFTMILASDEPYMPVDVLLAIEALSEKGFKLANVYTYLDSKVN